MNRLIEYKHVKCCGTCKKYKLSEITKKYKCNGSFTASETDYCDSYQHNGICDIKIVNDLKMSESCSTCSHFKILKTCPPSNNDSWICTKNPDVYKHCHPNTVCPDYRADVPKTEKIRQEFTDLHGVDVYGIRKAEYCSECKNAFLDRSDELDIPDVWRCKSHNNVMVKHDSVCDSFERKEEVKTIERKCINCKFVNSNIHLKGEPVYRCFAEKEPPEVKPDDCCSNFAPEENK